MGKRKKAIEQEKFTIIQDTREQTPFNFRPSTYVEGVKLLKLDTGDYTILGLEQTFVLERKKSVSEVATNVTDPRFLRELDRLAHFPLPFLICEFNLEDVLMYPVGSGIPKSRWRYLKTTGAFILNRLTAYQFDYGLRVMFAGSHGQTQALEIMKKVWRDRS